MRTSKVKYEFLEPLGIEMERYLSLEDLNGEIWKPLPGFEGLYEVSSMGRVKVLERDTSFKKVKRKMKTHILKPKTNGKRYWTVGLCVKNKLVYKYIHRLVVMAFLPNPLNKPEVDHLNTNTNDNRLTNLRWATHMENQYNPITRFRKLKQENDDFPIVQMTILGEKLAEWKNVREASYFTSITDSAICANILHPNRSYSAGGYIFVSKEFYEKGSFELPILKSSSKVIETGIPSELTIVLYLRGVLTNVYPSNSIAARQFCISPSTISTMCKNNVKGKYKSNEIQFKFFKDISEEEKMIVRKMLLSNRKVAG